MILSSCTYFANYYYVYLCCDIRIYWLISISWRKRNVGRSTLHVANKNGFSYRRRTPVPGGKVFSTSTTCCVDASHTSKFDCNLIHFKSRITKIFCYVAPTTSTKISLAFETPQRVAWERTYFMDINKWEHTHMYASSSK